ncbi:MAG TPA: hypothetical protein VL945_02125 [Candidatus Saccharimonadales bacterium]|nr:hypothetical protein [Candidatus Saccharimonadales bacterium]
MAKSQMDELTEETLGKGGILARLYFDMESEKAEDLQPIMTDLINNRLLKAAGVVYCYGTINEPMKLEKSYQTSAIVTALFKDVGSIMNVAFNFVPAGLEIIKPDRDIKMKPNELQAILLDLAQISINYSQYILSRVLSKEDYEKVMKDMKNREELGKKIIGKKEG